MVNFLSAGKQMVYLSSAGWYCRYTYGLSFFCWLVLQVNVWFIFLLLVGTAGKHMVYLSSAGW